MAMPDLYRIVIPDSPRAVFAEAGVQAWIDSGVLVKVEPDYEAAERAFRLDRDEPFGNLISDRLRRAIDAAFVRLDDE